LQGEFDRQSHHLVKEHAAEDLSIRQSAPGNKDATAIVGGNVRVNLRRIPAVAVLQTLRLGFRGEFPAVEFSNHINAIGTKKYPTRVMRIAVQRHFEKVRAFTVAGKREVLKLFPFAVAIYFNVARRGIDEKAIS